MLFSDAWHFSIKNSERGGKLPMTLADYHPEPARQGTPAII
jgi:hypothetical protein